MCPASSHASYLPITLRDMLGALHLRMAAGHPHTPSQDEVQYAMHVAINIANSAAIHLARHARCFAPSMPCMPRRRVGCRVQCGMYVAMFAMHQTMHQAVHTAMRPDLHPTCMPECILRGLPCIEPCIKPCIHPCFQPCFPPASYVIHVRDGSTCQLHVYSRGQLYVQGHSQGNSQLRKTLQQLHG